MSNLKHLSVEELRVQIRSLVNYRARLLAAAEKNEAEAEELLRAAAVKRKAYHNQGQREAWARIWLARKETGQ